VSRIVPITNDRLRVDTKGSEFFTIKIIEAETGALVDTKITDTNGDMQWDNDSNGLFYIWVDDEHRPRRVLRHVVGGEAKDAMIRDQKDPGFFLGIDATQSRRFLLLSVHDHETSEVSIIDTAQSDAKPVLVAKREPSRYSVNITATN
jgi:oligopeptidase B